MRSFVTAAVVVAIVAGGSAAHATSHLVGAQPPARATAAPVVLGYAAAGLGNCYAPGGGDITIIPVSTPASGPTYSTTTGGVLTSVGYVQSASASPDARVRAVVVRVAGPSYVVVAKSAPLQPVAGQTTTYPARLPMQPGDILAFNERSDGIGTACYSRTDGTSVGSNTDLDVNTSLVLTGGTTARLPDISAVLEPDADGDGYGDLTQDGCPQLASLQTTCPVPDTRISKAPRKRTHQHKVTVSFAATVPGATFECTLDKMAPTSCTSPLKVRAGHGRHLLLIQAAFAGQVDPTPLTVKWRVVKHRKH